MATLKIQIKDSKFVSHNGVNIKRFEETYVEGNGWKCTISENGRLDCIATEFYRGERHQIKLKIDKGYSKVILKIGSERPKTLKSYLLETWPLDGVIILPTGYIDKRYPHFRNPDFQKFLDEYKISSVRNESPNKIFVTMEDYNGHAVVFKEEIETDGELRVISEDVPVDEKSRENPFTIKRMLEVADATWVLKNVWKYGELKHRILFTLDNPKEIEGLPKIE